jgi:transcriptional regulator with XRE-family HTH domain
VSDGKVNALGRLAVQADIGRSMDSLLVTLVGVLDERRVALGISRSELARGMGVTPAAVTNFFTMPDLRTPRLKTVARVAAALGMRLSVHLDTPLDADLPEVSRG